MLNMYWENLDFELPAHRSWFKVVDTAAQPPHDIEDRGSEIPVLGSTYSLQGRSVVVLISG
jgi:pullulanase/glycogen debranching enzyme